VGFKKWSQYGLDYLHQLVHTPQIIVKWNPFCSSAEEIVASMLVTTPIFCDHACPKLRNYWKDIFDALQISLAAAMKCIIYSY